MQLVLAAAASALGRSRWIYESLRHQFWKVFHAFNVLNVLKASSNGGSCGAARACARRHVVSRFSRLTGAMALGPRWSLGFACTAMPLADAPDAQVPPATGWLGWLACAWV